MHTNSNTVAFHLDDVQGYDVQLCLTNLILSLVLLLLLLLLLLLAALLPVLFTPFLVPSLALLLILLLIMLLALLIALLLYCLCCCLFYCSFCCSCSWSLCSLYYCSFWCLHCLFSLFPSILNLSWSSCHIPLFYFLFLVQNVTQECRGSAGTMIGSIEGQWCALWGKPFQVDITDAYALCY